MEFIEFILAVAVIAAPCAWVIALFGHANKNQDDEK